MQQKCLLKDCLAKCFLLLDAMHYRKKVYLLELPVKITGVYNGLYGYIAFFILGKSHRSISSFFTSISFSNKNHFAKHERSQHIISETDPFHEKTTLNLWKVRIGKTIYHVEELTFLISNCKQADIR